MIIMIDLIYVNIFYLLGDYVSVIVLFCYV
jgi:hypothetical protein